MAIAVFFVTEEDKVPNKLEHFLSCTVAVIRRSGVTQYVYCFLKLSEILNICAVNPVLSAANKTKFSDVTKLCCLQWGKRRHVEAN